MYERNLSGRIYRGYGQEKLDLRVDSRESMQKFEGKWPLKFDINKNTVKPKKTRY